MTETQTQTTGETTGDQLRAMRNAADASLTALMNATQEAIFRTVEGHATLTPIGLAYQRLELARLKKVSATLNASRSQQWKLAKRAARTPRLAQKHEAQARAPITPPAPERTAADEAMDRADARAYGTPRSEEIEKPYSRAGDPTTRLWTLDEMFGGLTLNYARTLSAWILEDEHGRTRTFQTKRQAEEFCINRVFFDCEKNAR